MSRQSVLALLRKQMGEPISGEELSQRLGISRTDRFVRPAMMPHYDCDEELTSYSGGTPDGEDEDEMFFD